jgi:hypothetical protein
MRAGAPAMVIVVQSSHAVRVEAKSRWWDI